VGVCFGNRIVELETTAYAEQAAPITASAWPTICMTLRTVTDHQVPADQAAACAGLTPP
jgi:hypothetical protein